MVWPCQCRVCGTFVYIDDGPDATCPDCARMLETMAEIAAEEVADA